MSENFSSPESLSNQALIEHIALSPFRLLGLSAHSSRKEIERARSKTVAYLKLGRAQEHTFDFESLLGRTELTRESFDSSLARLHTEESKLEEALFWLVEVKETDTICLNHLRKGNSALALAICRKLADAGAIANEGTICLMLGDWKGFVQSRCKLFHEKNGMLFSDYVRLILGDKTWPDAPTFIAQYWQKVYSLLTTGERSALLKSFSESASEWETASSQLEMLRTHVCKTLSEELNRYLDVSEDSCRHSLQPILRMRRECQKLFADIGEILGKKHELYACLADTAANTMLRLLIQFHNHHGDNWPDTEKQTVLSLIQSARELAVGQLIREKCLKNETIIQSNFRKEQDLIFEQQFEPLFGSFSASVGNAGKKMATVVAATQWFLSECLRLLQQKDKAFTEQSQATRNRIVIQVLNALIDSVNAHRDGIGGLSSYSFWAVYSCLKDLSAFRPADQAKNALDDAQKAFRRSIAPEEKKTGLFGLSSLLNDPIDRLRELQEKTTRRLHRHPYPTRLPGIRGFARICFGLSLLCLLVSLMAAHQSKSSLAQTPPPPQTKQSTHRPASSAPAPDVTRARATEAVVPRVPDNETTPFIPPLFALETVVKRPEPERQPSSSTQKSPTSPRATVPNRHSFLTTGDRPYDAYWNEEADQRSNSYLTFENTTDKNVIVIMKEAASGKPLRHVYIASYRTHTMYHIKNGRYRLYYIYGTEWDPGLAKGKVAGCFSRDLSCSKSDDVFEAYDDGYSHSIGNIRLYTVRTRYGTSGNADVDDALSDI